MEKKVPEIRFKGYEEEWDSTTIGKISDRVQTKNTDNSVSLPLTASAQYGLVAQEEFFNSRIAAKDTSGYYVISKGEFAYNRSSSDGSPYGAVKRLDRYDAGVLSTLYLVFKLKDASVSSDYLVQYFSSTLWHDHIAQNAAEGARNHGLLNISSEDFLETPIGSPRSTDEQEKIGLLFKSLDRLIHSLEQKLEKLKNIKQSLLNQMFTNGNRGGYKPQIRFKEFNDDLTAMFLGQISDKYFVPNRTIHHQNLLSLSYGKIKRKDINSNKGLRPGSYDTYQLVKNGIIVMRFTDLQNDKKSLRVGIAKEEGIVSPAYTCISINENAIPEFMYVYLHYYDSVCKQFYKMGDGMRQTLSYKDIESLDIFLPTLEEQRKITHTFDEIDHCLSETDNKIVKLRSIKQTLLQKMFVN